MAHIAEVKFGDLQKDERYKKLERSLKLASLRRRSGKRDETWPLSTSPSISSINADLLDSSTNVPSLQTSRIGSVVVSSSNNLRNILLKRKDLHSDHERIATSSVKMFNKESDCSNDRLIMPPPNFDNVPRSSRKSNGIAGHNVAKSLAMSRSKCNSRDIDKESLKKMTDYKFSNGSGKHADNFSSLQSCTATVQNRKVTIFRRWKVMLHNQGQLIIKGTIECGQVARSKPVLRRLTSTSVESVFKHIYRLEGNILDDEYELPDYVRGKFFNGFPDDWENVHQIWCRFVQQGCDVTFRWPTCITDSDDDLRSEVTDITLAYSKSPTDEPQILNSANELRSSSFDHECTYNVLQTRFQESLRCSNYKKSDSFAKSSAFEAIGNSFHSGTNVNTSRNQYSNNRKSYRGQETIETDCSQITNDTSRLKDKLNVIMKNLAHKSCPQECITKIIEIFDCLNYVVSQGSIKENDESNAESSKTEHDKRVMNKQNNEVGNTSQDYLRRGIAPSRDSMCNKTANFQNSSQRKRTFTEMSKDNDSSTSDSESEIYAGVPKISMERILRQKGTLIKPYKRKVRKRVVPSKHDSTGKLRTLSIPAIPPNCITKSYVNAIRSEKVNGINFNDSSVSITEDERDNQNVERYTRSNMQRNVNEHIQSDTLKTWKRERSNDPLKNKNLYEMQEHFVRDNATAVYKSTDLGYDNYGVIKHNERDIVVAKRAETGISQENSFTEANREKGKENVNDQHQTRLSCVQPVKEVSSNLKDNTDKTTKPGVISLEPLNVDITNMRSKRFAQDQKVIRSEEKDINNLSARTKNKSIEQVKSPIKSNVGRKNNINFLTNGKQLSEARDQSNNANFSSEKSSRDHLQVSHGNRFTDDNKPKLLSAWTPKVVCESELYLIFEGKLLNEAGHVVHRKFKTDAVLRRVSSRLIETRHHEFYQLTGDLNDAKHDVPKELLNQCRYGCPDRIEQFCRAWNSLLQRDRSEKLNDTSMDAINIGVSSKGRRIVPPLSYWTGERIALKDNSPVYRPGNLQDSLMIPSYDDVSTKNKQANNARQQKKDKGKKRNFNGSKDTTPSSPEMLINDASNGTTRMKMNKFKKSVTNEKERTSQRDASGSSEDKGIVVHKRKKTKTRHQESPNSVNVASKLSTRLMATDNSHESYAAIETTELAPRRTNTGGTKEAVTLHISPSKQTLGNYQLSAGKYRDVVCTYYRDIPAKDDVLSDDQVSHV